MFIQNEMRCEFGLQIFQFQTLKLISRPLNRLNPLNLKLKIILNLNQSRQFECVCIQNLLEICSTYSDFLIQNLDFKSQILKLKFLNTAREALEAKVWKTLIKVYKNCLFKDPL